MFEQVKQDYAKLLGRKEALQERILTTKQNITTLSNEIETLDSVGVVFRQLLDDEVASSVKAVEELLSEALQAVFTDQSLRVRANISVLRGKVSVELLTIQDHGGGVIIEGQSSEGFGGAVTTVQSIILRILVCLKRGMRPFLLLDESLPAFDSNYVHNMGNFLSSLCGRLGIDILLVTHNQHLVEASDKAFIIDKKKGKATFSKVVKGSVSKT
jgi:ABC-type glutathione transport system ATPase component